ncbi:unnamed protein product [Ectocarpus sp. 12 AP-2014]
MVRNAVRIKSIIAPCHPTGLCVQPLLHGSSTLALPSHAFKLWTRWDFDETWGYTHTSVVGETGTVCNWDDVVPGSGDMPTCITGICGGHNEDDLLPFTVKVNGENVQLTNAGWMDLIYPTNEDLPYMYDEFKWDHCSEDGYSFGT